MMPDRQTHSETTEHVDRSFAPRRTIFSTIRGPGLWRVKAGIDGLDLTRDCGPRARAPNKTLAERPRVLSVASPRQRRTGTGTTKQWMSSIGHDEERAGGKIAIERARW